MQDHSNKIRAEWNLSLNWSNWVGWHTGSFYCKKLKKNRLKPGSCTIRGWNLTFHSRPALAQQHKYVEKLSKRGGSEEVAGYLLAVEHDPVYTVGMRARKDYRNQVKQMIPRPLLLLGRKWWCYDNNLCIFSASYLLILGWHLDHSNWGRVCWDRPWWFDHLPWSGSDGHLPNPRLEKIHHQWPWSGQSRL